MSTATALSSSSWSAQQRLPTACNLCPHNLPRRNSAHDKIPAPRRRVTEGEEGHPTIPPPFRGIFLITRVWRVRRRYTRLSATPPGPNLPDCLTSLLRLSVVGAAALV